MKSKADESPKRIKKMARQYSDEEVRASLGEDDDTRAFLFEHPNGLTEVMYWTAHSGMMVMMDDDSARIHAQIDFLRRHGYPIFRSDHEIHAYADEHGWPRNSGRNKYEKGA